MGTRPDISTRFLAALIFSGLGLSAADPSGNTSAAPLPLPAPMQLSFIKGDTREGSKVHIRVAGDSLHYRRTEFSPGKPPLVTKSSAVLDQARRKTLRNVMAELPRYPVFGSCHGKDMRYYMIETEQGNFYRSLPEHIGKCYQDQPGIWSFFQDLDILITPPRDEELQEYSAS
jgi:hypothetical protein